MGGGRVIGVGRLGSCTLNISHYRVINFLVNMESIQDNHDRRVF